MKRKYSLRKKRLSNSNLIRFKNSFEVSNKLGFHLKRHLTVNVEQITGQSDCKKLIAKILQCYRNFANSRNFSSSYVWVVEHGGYNGAHVHFLFYIPSSRAKPNYREFKRKLESLIQKWNEYPQINSDCINWTSIKFGDLLNPIAFCQDLDLVTNLIIEYSRKLSPQELAVAAKNNGVGRHNHSGLLTIFNYLCKGVQAGSQGTFKGTRFGCSKWHCDHGKLNAKLKSNINQDIKSGL